MGGERRGGPDVTVGAPILRSGLEPVVGLDRLSVEGRHTMRFELGTRASPVESTIMKLIGVWYSGPTEYRASTWSPPPLSASLFPITFQWGSRGRSGAPSNSAKQLARQTCGTWPLAPV
jgi:hypothetical protein